MKISDKVNRQFTGMNGQQLRSAIRGGEKVFGTAILSTSPLWVTATASLSLDFVLIDTEHTPIDREILSWMCLAYKLAGMVPVVRIPSPDPYEATMAIDGGAEGILAPYIETAEQVKAIAGAVKYRPLKGEKLERFLMGDAPLEPSLLTYLQEVNRNNLFFINLESIPAIGNLDRILSVKDLDGVLIGPHDLTCSLGIPEQYTHPKFLQAAGNIITSARAHGVGAGVHMFYPSGFEQEIKWAETGANIILHNSDIGSFKNTIHSGIGHIREKLSSSLTLKDNRI